MKRRLLIMWRDFRRSLLSIAVCGLVTLAAIAVAWAFIVLLGILTEGEGRLTHHLQDNGSSKLMHDMHDVAAAINAYKARTGKYPPPYLSSKNGTMTLSWRVALLPDLGEWGLYSQFDIDQPWDSEKNLAGLANMPRCFAHPKQDRDQIAKGFTHLMATKSKAGYFSGQPLTSIKSLQMPALVVESRQAVEWTRPGGFVHIEVANPGLLGHLSAGGFYVGFADESVAFVHQ